MSGKKRDLSHFPITAIRVAPENDLLYEPFGLANADDMDLALSIRDHGIQEALVLSSDGFLLSGHRRLHAAIAAELATVPVRTDETVRFGELDGPRRLEVLRRFNQQRDKSPGERLREKLLEIDPADAWGRLKRRQIERRHGSAIMVANVVMGAIKKRPRITTLQFLAATQRVIEENRRYWPLTDRRIHYLLLNDPPLRHDRKPASTYVNDRGCYKALTNLLLRARLTGDIAWEAIEDTTRPIQLGGGYQSAAHFIHEDVENFLQGYGRNLMQGQPAHIEIMLEKNALRTVIEEVAREYSIPMTTGRGYSSVPPRYELVQRFRMSGKDRLILLMLTDYDPDGEEIAASFARSLRDDFGVDAVHPIKVALTADDVRTHNLPSDMDAKMSSPNFKKFVRKYGGTKVAELDAAPVDLLQVALRRAIASVIEVKEYEAQLALERNDAAFIEAHRRLVLDAIRGVGAGGSS